MAKVLFVTYGGGHVLSCMPVAESLRSRGHCVYFLALTTAHAVAAKNGLNPLGFKDFLFPNIKARALKIGASLMNQEANGLVDPDESMAYLGMNYLDLEESFGKVKAKEIYSQRGRQAFLPLNTMEKIISDINPDLVITTASPRAELAAQIAAHKLGINAVCILDLPSKYMIEQIANLPGQRVICVGSDVARQCLSELGVSKELIHVTGNPAFDSLTKVTPIEIKAYRQRLGLDIDGKLIMWASQVEPLTHPITGELGNPLLPYEIESTLRNWVVEQSSCKLVMRYHPSEIREHTPSPNTFHSKSEDNVDILINSCDILVTMTSTVAFQAAHLGKKVITYDTSVFSKEIAMSMHGISKGVLSHAELIQSLNSMINRRTDILEETQFSHINATSGVVTVIEKSLNV
jgi:UDP-N-acetylglucosamine 2-epimerase